MKKLYKWLLNTLPRPMLIRLSYVFRIFAPLVYRGNKVECPVCERTFRKFLSYGSNVAHRENVLCPYDLTLERHRAMWLYLKTKTDFFKKPGIHVMHIAPEQCFHKKFKNQANLIYVTSDLESPIADMHFDLHDIPLPGDSYEVIFCNHVMEHVKDDLQCMKEIYRIMKPGGWGIMQAPIDVSRSETYEDWSITSPEEREKHFRQKDHVRLYGTNYPKRLGEAGFRVEVVDLTKDFPESQFQKFRIPKDELIYVVRKT